MAIAHPLNDPAGMPPESPPPPLMRYASPILFYGGLAIMIWGLLDDRWIMPFLGLLVAVLGYMGSIGKFEMDLTENGFSGRFRKDDDEE